MGGAALTARVAQSLVWLAERITGKTVHVIDVHGWVRHSDTAIEVGHSDTWTEDLVHEVLHWVVASDAQRQSPDNLGMGHSFDGYDGRTLTTQEIAQQERAVARLQLGLYAAAGHAGKVRAKDTPRYAAEPLPEECITDALERARDVGWRPLLDLVRLAVEGA